MTTSSERATALLGDKQKFVRRGQGPDEMAICWVWYDDMHSRIAKAIREAEDAALEMAAEAAINASRGMSCFVGLDDCQLFNQGVMAAEKAVLALKSQEPSP